MQHVRAAWRRWVNSPARDVIFALGLTVVLVGGTYGEGHPKSPSDTIQFKGLTIPHPGPGALALVAVACLALAWRRQWPVAVLGVSTAAVCIFSLLGYVNGAAMLAPAIAVYSMATLVDAWRAAGLALAALIVLMAATAAGNPFGKITGGGFYLIPGLIVGALLAGIAVANRRAYVASIQDRAQEDARRQVVEERLRIARELHDVVAHTMATINVQAGSAAHVLATRPEVAAEALQAIKAASKDGLRELRAILNVLRQADDADPTQPTPGLAQLDTLVAGARRAGLETRLTVTGAAVPLPAAADLAAYRIIQESLTNTIRHAGPATAAVSVSYTGDEVRICVSDTGLGEPVLARGDDPPEPPDRRSAPRPAKPAGRAPATLATGTGGHGLAGMRERAIAVGGSVETGPAPGGGFRVTARLPLPGQPGGEPPRDSPSGSAESDPGQAPDTAATAAEEGGRP
jgi:signal transduction histidine kinase